MTQKKLKKQHDSKARIKKTELLLIEAMEQVVKEYPEITTAELGAAMLKLLSKINNHEIAESWES